MSQRPVVIGDALKIERRIGDVAAIEGGCRWRRGGSGERVCVSVDPFRLVGDRDHIGSAGWDRTIVRHVDGWICRCDQLAGDSAKVSARVPRILTWFPVAPEATNVKTTPFRVTVSPGDELETKVTFPVENSAAFVS